MRRGAASEEAQISARLTRKRGPTPESRHSRVLRIRVSDRMWEALQRRAEREEECLSVSTRQLLATALEEDGYR